MILEDFSNLNDSMILWMYDSGQSGIAGWRCILLQRQMAVI